jgi:hypothetical protein
LLGPFGSDDEPALGPGFGGAELDCPVVLLLLVKSTRPMVTKKPVIKISAMNAPITQRRSWFASPEDIGCDLLGSSRSAIASLL